MFSRMLEVFWEIFYVAQYFWQIIYIGKNSFLLKNLATQKILMLEKDRGKILLRMLKKIGSFGIFRVPQNVIKVDLFYYFFHFCPKNLGALKNP